MEKKAIIPFRMRLALVSLPFLAGLGSLFPMGILAFIAGTDSRDGVIKGLFFVGLIAGLALLVVVLGESQRSRFFKLYAIVIVLVLLNLGGCGICLHRLSGLH